MLTNAILCPDFEKPIVELEGLISQVKKLAEEKGEDHGPEITDLEEQKNKLIRKIFAKLTPWEITQLARHPKRPYTFDYLMQVFENFTELHGDRLYGDDAAMLTGIGKINGQQVAFVGQQKGRNIKERQYRNFGMAKPEGYRKALRIMKLAEKFKRPVICFVDTPAADCSIEAEERGISEAIARNMKEMSELTVPIVVAIIGEGGSGGALGIGVGDRILMLEYSIYSVIPPEGCASILWRDVERKKEAAAALKLTAQDALRLGVIDEILPEPLGGAHRNATKMAEDLKKAIVHHLDELTILSREELLVKRFEKFRHIGSWTTEG